MEKAVILLSLLALLTTSNCRQAAKKQIVNEQIHEIEEIAIEQNNEVNEFIIEKNSDRKVKYYFRSNGGSILFFDDGTAFRCARCELIGDLENYEPDITYTESPSGVSYVGSDFMFDFFDDLGCITVDWLIFNHHKVESPFQITNFEPYAGSIPADSILTVTKTCLVEMMPEIEYFGDEESQETQAYSTSTDDYAYYMSETRTRFSKMGVKSMKAEKRYLSFTLASGEQIIINTQKEQNGRHVDALLYKKGHIPIFIDIRDNDIERIDDYLKLQ